MLITIANILNSNTLAEAQSGLGKIDWKDGRATAGKTAAEVKDNLQADLSSQTGQSLRTMLKAAIFAHPVAKAFARPNKVSPLLISKTTNGGKYGPHIDNALMKIADGQLRTDLSFTLGLSDPASYEGGELTIHLPGSIQTFKPAPGEMVIYPSSSIHEVKPVTSGERIVCVGWIQSSIRDAATREILFDLENLRATLRQSYSRDTAVLLTLDKSIANLLRLHAEN